jgi:hypothetical protein
VPGHSRLYNGAGSPVSGDVECHCLPHRDGPTACCASGGGILCHVVCAQALVQRHLLGGGCGRGGHQVLGVGRVTLAL